MTKFDALEVAQQVRDRLWRYLEANAAPADVASVAEELFQLDEGELRRLAAVHVGVASETHAMLAAAPLVLRELPSSVTRSRVETRGRVLMPVNWPTTLIRRRQEADPTLFRSSPPERAYDTALGRLVSLSLRQCSELPEIASLSPGPLARLLDERHARAAHFLAHRKLREVTPVKGLPERTLHALGKFRHAEPLIRFARLFREAVAELSPRITHAVVTRHLLVPSAADRLFELFVGFRIVDALCDQGFRQHDFRLTPGRQVPLARLIRGREQATVWWQRPTWSALGRTSREGRYAEILRSASMAHGTLRPDFTVAIEPGGKTLLVEVKLTEREGETRDRDGIRDVLAYLHDLGPFVEDRPEPHALVVAWDAEGKPAPGPVIISDQNRIADAVAIALAEWGV